MAAANRIVHQCVSNAARKFHCPATSAKYNPIDYGTYCADNRDEVLNSDEAHQEIQIGGAPRIITIFGSVEGSYHELSSTRKRVP